MIQFRNCFTRGILYDIISGSFPIKHIKSGLSEAWMIASARDSVEPDLTTNPHLAFITSSARSE